MITAKQSAEIINGLVQSASRGIELRQQAMNALSQLSGYDWTGIYILSGDQLRLDAYVGDPTDHTVIPVGRGVCGAAVVEDKNQVVSDVRELSNYLACSLKTRAEIVVLIRKGEQVLGQIDVDSHKLAAFDSSDEQFLEGIAKLLAERWDD